MAENNPKPILDSDEILRRVNETNKFLEEATASQLVVASHGIPINGPVVKFDGATERYSGVVHTAEYVKTRIASCREAYENAGIIGNAIDLMVDFGMEGFDIVHPDPIIQNFYRAWAIRVGLESLSSQILKCYFRDGNVPILSFRGRIKAKEFEKLKKAVGANLFTDDNLSAKVIPYAYHVLDVLCIEKWGSELLDNVRFEYRISAEDLRPLKDPRAESNASYIEELRKAIGDEDFKYLSDSGYLRFAPGRLSMLYYKKDDYRAWANPMFWRVMDDVKFKKLLRDMDVSVCESVINTLIVIALGNTVEGFPATPAMFEKLSNLMKTPTKSKTLIWNDLIKIMAEYPPVERILGKEKYEQVDADIRAGLGIAEVVLNGQGNNYANSFLSVKTLLERLEGGRNVLLTWLEAEVRNIAKAMGFKQPAWFKMHHMSLRDEEAEKRLLLELVDRGMVSYETCVDRFGENFQIELERMKREDNFRRKNERKYPFTLVKTGKFGPQLINGPLPIFELLDAETIDQAQIRQGSKKDATPTTQESQGDKGGRPGGAKKPQKKTETPRSAPKGQKVSANVKSYYFDLANDMFDTVYFIVSKSILKARKTDVLSKDDQIVVFRIISQVIGAFSNVEDINKDNIQSLFKKKDQLSQDIGQYIVMSSYNGLVDKFFKQYNAYPDFNDLRDIITSTLAIMLGQEA